jgi:hypothetical protein
MAGKANYRKWCGAKHSEKKVCWLKCDISRVFETLGFTLLGWPYSDKETFFPYESFSIKDESHIRFSEDKCLRNTTLCEQYPVMYNIVCHKGDTLAKLLESSPSNMTFRRRPC